MGEGRSKNRRPPATHVQTLLFSKGKFSKGSARTWATGHDFKAPASDPGSEDAEYIRIRQRRPGDFSPRSFRTIDLDTGVKAVIGRLKSGRYPNPTDLAGPEAQVKITRHPGGIAHTKASIRKMAKLVKRGATCFEIRDKAVKITKEVPSKDTTGELAAIYKWVRDNIRYREDPIPMEWIQGPGRTLEQGAGDCDDIAVLIASLAESIGRKTRFVTVGQTPTRQQHIAAQAFTGRHWITLDPVLEPPQPTTAPRPNDLGKFARTPTGGSKRYWSSHTGKPIVLGSPVRTALLPLWPSLTAFPAQPAFQQGPTAAARKPAPIAGYLSADAIGGGRPHTNYSLLGSWTDAADRELWPTLPAFPSTPPEKSTVPGRGAAPPRFPPLAEYLSADAIGGGRPHTDVMLGSPVSWYKATLLDENASFPADKSRPETPSAIIKAPPRPPAPLYLAPGSRSALAGMRKRQAYLGVDLEQAQEIASKAGEIPGMAQLPEGANAQQLQQLQQMPKQKITEEIQKAFPGLPFDVSLVEKITSGDVTTADLAREGVIQLANAVVPGIGLPLREAMPIIEEYGAKVVGFFTGQKAKRERRKRNFKKMQKLFNRLMDKKPLLIFAKGTVPSPDFFDTWARWLKNPSKWYDARITKEKKLPYWVLSKNAVTNDYSGSGIPGKRTGVTYFDKALERDAVLMFLNNYLKEPGKADLQQIAVESAIRKAQEKAQELTGKQPATGVTVPTAAAVTPVAAAPSISAKDLQSAGKATAKATGKKVASAIKPMKKELQSIKKVLQQIAKQQKNTTKKQLQQYKKDIQQQKKDLLRTVDTRVASAIQELQRKPVAQMYDPETRTYRIFGLSGPRPPLVPLGAIRPTISFAFGGLGADPPGELFDVKYVQQLVKDLGGDITVDGFWGPGSRTALQDVCTRYGLKHTPRKATDYYSSTSRGYPAGKVMIRPKGLIEALEAKRAALQAPAPARKATAAPIAVAPVTTRATPPPAPTAAPVARAAPIAIAPVTTRATEKPPEPRATEQPATTKKKKKKVAKKKDKKKKKKKSKKAKAKAPAPATLMPAQGAMPVLATVPEALYDKALSNLKKAKNNAKTAKKKANTAKKQIKALKKQLKTAKKTMVARSRSGELVEIGRSKKDAGLPSIRKKDRTNTLQWLALWWLATRG